MAIHPQAPPRTLLAILGLALAAAFAPMACVEMGDSSVPDAGGGDGETETPTGTLTFTLTGDL